MLLKCTVYREGRVLADIPVEDISEYLTQPDCFVWVAIMDPDLAELTVMQEEFNLHPLAVEDALHGHQQPKIEEYGNSIFGVMQLLTVFGDEIQIGELHVFVGKNYVLSVRNRNSADFSQVRARCESEPELLKNGPGFVFYALLDAAVDRYFLIIDAMEVELEGIEERIFDKHTTRSSIEQLYNLKRKITVVRHAITPLMEGTGKVCGGRVPPMCQNIQNYFRDVLDHLTRINAILEAIRETLSTAIQVNLAMISLEENEANKRISAWAGIFAAGTIITGVWGMNFQHMPELQWQWGYPVALATLTGVCGYLYYRFKKAGWL